MLRPLLPGRLRPSLEHVPQCVKAPRGGTSWLPHWHRTIIATNFELKYADKLGQRAKEAGISVDELKAKIRQEQTEVSLRRRKEAEKQASACKAQTGCATESITTGSVSGTADPSIGRKDSSPVKPLSSILNLQKIISSPHTLEQIESLWVAYHLSRSGGTGRGYICASIPISLYKKMESVAQRYPTLVVPIARTAPLDLREGEAGRPQEETAYEFYFLQWDFHEHPFRPCGGDLFVRPSPTGDPSKANPRTSTVLFTPLQEYKMRGAFATPYLVLTHHTDLSATHDLVLMRGEITPATVSAGGGVDGRYMLTQEDAQSLAMVLQKFYLWDQDGSGEGEKLLKCFHETPGDFKWEDLVQYVNKTAP